MIALAYIFVGVYGLAWAPGAWIYASEVFPLRYRAKGVGLAAAGNWRCVFDDFFSNTVLLTSLSPSFNLALAFFVPPAFENIKWKTYLIFGTFCFAMTVHIFLTYPETVRKSLEEIDHLFEQKVPAWRTASVGTFDDKVQEMKRTGEMKRDGANQVEQEEDV